MDEEHPLNPRSPYAATKAGADRLAYSYYVTYGLPIVILRPFNNYGPYQHPEKVVPRFVTQALADLPLTVHGDGHASRDWLYVEDHAEAIDAVLAADISDVAGEVLNLATGADISVSRIADLVLEQLGQAREPQGPRPRAAGPGRPARRLDGEGRAAPGLARADVFRGGARAHHRLVRAESSLVGSGSSSGTDGERKRLLVLGAGPAQLGLHRAARERGLFVIACDRDPTAVGFEYADRRAVVSVEDEAAIVQLARAEQVDGIIAPGIDWPVAIAARIAAHAGLPHPIAPGDGRAHRPQAPPAQAPRRARASRSRAGRSRPRRPTGCRCPPWSSPSTARARRGSRSSPTSAELAEAIAAAVEASRNGLALVEELVPGPEITVNAFSVGGVFHPLTVTDRLTGDGARVRRRARARLAERHAVEEAVEAARLAADALGVTDGPTYTQIVLGPDGPARDGARRPPRRRPRRRALPGRARDRPERARARRRARRAASSCPSRSRSAAPCVRFLVPPEGVLEARRRASRRRSPSTGVVDARVYRPPGWQFGPVPPRATTAPATSSPAARVRDDALARADRAAELIRFRTADAEALLEA